ncbi:DUF805 domain-containing protein [Aurantimicrobium photophilum]|uniref:Inner membrane protein YhaI n=1 Tax=Aurantimicrobium photophilum TaxID=1987356 RepID=A0A2Z3S071_9MICO|nr:DUF805 domain-containing protein [Aurantimicrobium photophilum]AWR21714.1 Inner membrane protein YhaI [Aurantimicrobium photophilum]
MTFGESITIGFKNYANFQGRSRRSGYWWWFLFTVLVSAAFNILSGDKDNFFSDLGSLASLALLLPSLAFGVRRLHDTNRSGWHLLYGLIPIAGFIMLLIWFVQDSDVEANRFGASPKPA